MIPSIIRINAGIRKIHMYMCIDGRSIAIEIVSNRIFRNSINPTACKIFECAFYSTSKCNEAYRKSINPRDNGYCISITERGNRDIFYYSIDDLSIFLSKIIIRYKVI